MSTEKLRFGDVAHAIGSTPKTLRNWLQRGQVNLASVAPADGSWREFELADVPQLALVRSIVAFGIEVKEADLIAREVLKGREVYEVESTGGIRMDDVDVALSPTENGWEWFEFNRRTQAVDAISRTPATLVLGVGQIIATALQRVLDRVDSAKVPA